jgi:hypothetical protein
MLACALKKSVLVPLRGASKIACDALMDVEIRKPD